MLLQYTHTSQHSTLPPPPQPCGPASPFRGNHDVNRKQCASYFSECEADETDPVFPWFPKWKQFKEAFDEFYRDFPAITFTPAEPWTVFEIPDVGVVVAGLNSTMDEGHDDAVNGLTDPGHHGLCTESQLRWFEKRFESDDYRGWLRIGAIHHNIERGCRNDNENLRDAEELGNILAGSLDLILHGHMQHAKRQRSKGGPCIQREVRPY